jgi:hypothetical protein
MDTYLEQPDGSFWTVSFPLHVVLDARLTYHSAIGVHEQKYSHAK